jgi:hypothetical protein
LKSASSIPEYQGTPIELGQHCEPAPLPHLKDASHLSTNSSETTMHWPPYDAFYSNCARNLYCNSDRICEHQLPQGSTCQSDNQCLNRGQCKNQVCCNNSTSSAHRSYNTFHIILTVLGIVLAFAVVFGAYFYKRRRRQKKEQLLQEKPTAVVDRSNSSFSSSQSPPHHSAAVTNMLDYDTSLSPLPPLPPLPTQPLPQESMSSSSHRHTPSMQQRQLQYQLQRQLMDKKSVETGSIQPPPPPYSP